MRRCVIACFYPFHADASFPLLISQLSIRPHCIRTRPCPRALIIPGAHKVSSKYHPGDSELNPCRRFPFAIYAIYISLPASLMCTSIHGSKKEKKKIKKRTEEIRSVFPNEIFCVKERWYSGTRWSVIPHTNLYFSSVLTKLRAVRSISPPIC